MKQKKRFSSGFSLVEILFVLVIIAILVIALTPVYRDYVLKSNRSDAVRSLLATQINEEKWRLNNTTYTATIANVSPTGASTSINGYYTLAVTSASASAYTLTATATGTQTSDTGCTTMTLTYASGTTTTTPAVCWQ